MGNAYDVLMGFCLRSRSNVEGSSANGWRASNVERVRLNQIQHRIAIQFPLEKGHSRNLAAKLRLWRSAAVSSPTSRSRLDNTGVSSISNRPIFMSVLRLVSDTAALRDGVEMRSLQASPSGLEPA